MSLCSEHPVIRRLDRRISLLPSSKRGLCEDKVPFIRLPSSKPGLHEDGAGLPGAYSLLSGSTWHQRRALRPGRLRAISAPELWMFGAECSLPASEESARGRAYMMSAGCGDRDHFCSFEIALYAKQLRNSYPELFYKQNNTQCILENLSDYRFYVFFFCRDIFVLKILRTIFPSRDISKYIVVSFTSSNYMVCGCSGDSRNCKIYDCR